MDRQAQRVLARQPIFNSARVVHGYEFDKGAAKWFWLERNRWRIGVIGEFRATIAGQPRADIVAKGFPDFVGILPFHQTE